MSLKRLGLVGPSNRGCDLLSERLRIVILHGWSSIEACHSLMPFFLREVQREFSITFQRFDDRREKTITGDLLIIVRKFHSRIVTNDDIEAYFSGLRRRFSRIVYFDDSASIASVQPAIIGCVDQYWKRALLRDRSTYTKAWAGGHLFSDFYQRTHGLSDTSQFVSAPIEEKSLLKLRVAWNVGCGVYPLPRSFVTNNNYSFIRRVFAGCLRLGSYSLIELAVNQFHARLKHLKSQLRINQSGGRFVSARYQTTGYDLLVGFQRTFSEQLLSGKDNVSLGTVPRRLYLEELAKASAVYSPFGWGEICFRDYECLLNGALLIKPDMSHVQTFPDIYKENCYLPVSWDLSDLLEVIDEALSYHGLDDMPAQAFDFYKSDLSRLGEHTLNLIRSV